MSSFILMLLIFLVVLLFVGIFAGMILQSFSDRETNLSGALQCQKIKITPTLCSYLSHDKGYTLRVSAYRGGNSAPLKGIYIILAEMESRETKKFKADNIPAVLETSQILLLEGFSLKNYTEVAIVPIIEVGSTEFFCPQSKTLPCA